MARQQKLKVFRLPVGFHDAYVAAPSQKAAIEAWGADRDVFQRKEAELVTDPALAKEPLAHPGKIIKRLRGTAAEQIAALGGEDAPVPPRKGKAPTRKPLRPGPQAAGGALLPPEMPASVGMTKATRRPSRAALDKAEAALAEAEARQAEAMKALRAREAALAKERKALERAQDAERARLEARRDKARDAHDAALEAWRRS